jgi:orotate phosphoribosyltransferase
MNRNAVPMIHVPDVRATVEWYQSIGFSVIHTYGDDGGDLSFALLSFGRSMVMFNEGGQFSTSFRREVDLYVYADRVDEMYERLKDRVDIVETPHETFYGMRELIVRDLNRFWITFGQPVDEARLASRIDTVSRLQGTFRLRSGVMSKEYFDKYRFESDPELLMEIAEGLAAQVPDNIEILAGLELGGIPISTALSIQTGLPMVFVRKQAKEYGTCRLAEGIEISGRRLLIVEDVVTSGGQILASCEELRKAGAIVEHVVCVIDRQAGGREALAAAGLELRSLFTKKDLDELRFRE